jgi:hypothetical protein
MKPSRALKIYIASSARNIHAVDMLMALLKDAGHFILDWTQYLPPLGAHVPPDKRRRLIDSDERGYIFEFCVNSSAGADLVIYLGESGQDAACEVGIAFNAGVPVIGMAGPLEAPGLILTRAVTVWCDSINELLGTVEEFAEGNPAWRD